MRTPKTETPPAATEGVGNDIAGEQEQATAVAVDAQLYAEPLSCPPGLVGELASYFYTSARYPMKEGALLAALGLMAAVAGRRFYYDGTGLNLYLLLLAESGRGKDDMQDGIDRLLFAVRPSVAMVDSLLGPKEFASGQGLIRYLDNNGSFLSIWGEFGLRLKQLNHPRSSSAEVMLRRAMMDLYSRSGKGKVHRSSAYSDSEKNTKTIEAPAVSILGESTPGHVYDNLTFRDIEDGLLPRCLVLECLDGYRPPKNPMTNHPPGPPLVSRFSELMEMRLRMDGNRSFCAVVATDEAKAELDVVDREMNEIFNDFDQPPHERALWNRAGLNITRVAALIAVGCMPANGTPVMELEHVEWADAFVRYCVQGLAEKFRDGLVGTGDARLAAEVKKYVREFLAMSPRQRKNYKVPNRLCEAHQDQRGYVGFNYLNIRASRFKGFTDDPRGQNRALTETLAALCRDGTLIKVPQSTSVRDFSTSQDVYLIARLDE